MKFSELNAGACNFLRSLADKYSAKADDGIPVYLRAGDEAHFIEDFKLPVGANGDFEKGAAGHNLYRGGAVIMVHSEHGQIVTYDDRYNWWKPIAGIAHFNEGADLMKAAVRELMEELYVMSCFNKEQKRYVPKGQGATSGMCSLGFEAQVIELGSEVSHLEYVFNDENRAYECVAQWNMPDMPGPWSCVNQEEWFLPGESGIVFAALGDGGVAGYFSGQQGFVPTDTVTLHPSLARYTD